MTETAKHNAEEITGVSDPSTDKEVDIDNMSEEELREFAKREHEAKKEANRHMREQARKRKEAHVEEPKEVIESKQTENGDDVEAIVRKTVQSELQKRTVESASEGSESWLKGQEFAKDLFGESEESDRLYARVQAHAKRMADEEGVKSPEKYQEILRRAHVAITGKPDALINRSSAEPYIANDKGKSAGYRGSMAPKQSPSYGEFSQADMVLIDRVNARRAARGEKPLTPGEILKK